MTKRPPVTSHILDTTRGCPAAEVPLQIFKQDGKQWIFQSSGETDADGRCGIWKLDAQLFVPGIYKVVFEVSSYFQKTNTKAFYPFVEVVFEVHDEKQHYHIPLLISPFGYSTYRGS